MNTVTKPISPAAQSAAGQRIAQKQIWLNHLDEAQLYWNKLSREHLLQSEGLPHRLCRLLQQHYDFSREQADHQIHQFKQSCQLSPEPHSSDNQQQID